MGRSILSPMPSSHHFSIYRSTPRRRLSVGHSLVGISAFIHAHRKLAVRAVMQPSSTPASDDDVAPTKEDAKKNSSDAAPNRPSLPLPNIPTWARWVLGSAILLALPFYKRILRIEDEVEKTAEAVVEVVEKVAEATEKISKEVADSLPENTKLKQVALEVEQIAEVVVKDAEVAETLIKKVDVVVQNVENMVEPMIEEALEGNQGGKGTIEGTDWKKAV